MGMSHEQLEEEVAAKIGELTLGGDITNPQDQPKPPDKGVEPKDGEPSNGFSPYITLRSWSN